jgi:hypothetical protein
MHVGALPESFGAFGELRRASYERIAREEGPSKPDHLPAVRRSPFTGRIALSERHELIDARIEREIVDVEQHGNPPTPGNVHYSLDALAPREAEQHENAVAGDFLEKIRIRKMDDVRNGAVVP